MNILLIFPGFIVAFIIVLYYECKIRDLSAKFKNNVHFYVARDKDGRLYLYLGKPRRGTVFFISFVHPSDFICRSDRFDSFGLNEKDYANLRWEDEPVEVFIKNMED